VFLNFAENARKDPKNKYVMVIDELNRGDVARIFGEVLTYIESTYRNIEFTLPYSGERISIPDNLILIATANPYDRSVIDLDDALLRRFWVYEMDPDKAILQNHLETEGVDENVCKRTIQLFTILNEVFPYGYGHSSFLGVRDLNDLSAIWMGKIRPALKRTLLHDKNSYISVEGEVESLLKIRADEPDFIGGEDA
jgi:ATPase family associated with various cellular activities (AAA).